MIANVFKLICTICLMGIGFAFTRSLSDLQEVSDRTLCGYVVIVQVCSAIMLWC